MEWNTIIKKLLFKVDKNTFFIIGLAGILLFVILIPTSQEEDRQVPSSQVMESITSTETVVQDDQTYVAELEERLEGILSDMEGSGSVSVMITLESTYEEVLQKDGDSSSNQIEEVDSAGGTRITSDISSSQATVYEELSNGEKSPYVIKKNTPKIEGVFVVAQGGGNEVVCKNITDVIQALFGIEAHKIKVVKMK